MNIRNLLLMVLCLTVIAGSAFAGSKKRVSDDVVKQAKVFLQTSVEYSAKTPYSKTIPYFFLGYSKDGSVEQGVALRSFKTYEWVTAMIVVKKEGEKYIVAHAVIPDIASIKDDKKREKVLDAIKGMKGLVLQDEKKGFDHIDAVTGATRYNKRIYLYFDKMAEALVHEMKANPAWERKVAPVK